MTILTCLSTDIDKFYRMDESMCIKKLTEIASLSAVEFLNIKNTSRKLITSIRSEYKKAGMVDAFMKQYDLSTSEGIALMCLAEALLRIPDEETKDDLIQDKITSLNWKKYVGKSDSTMVNLSTWLLNITSQLLGSNHENHGTITKLFSDIMRSTSKPFIRKSFIEAIKLIGKNFVLAEDIKIAIKRADENKEYIYSFDMLGEAARTEKDAEKYFEDYRKSIAAVSEWNKRKNNKDIILSSSISIKLSALDPRYEVLHTDRVLSNLYPKLKQLILEAKEQNVAVTIDAEESERLEISLHILKMLCEEPELKGWNGIGLAVQAYQKRAIHVLGWLIELAEKTDRRIMVRLVKGAYWDTEIKRYQELGLEEYPVFTRKCYTDVSYIACAKKLFKNQKHLYPQFATHNAMTVATIIEIAKKNKDYEFQSLHGMGHHLYDLLLKKKILKVPCRIYAPVGNHIHLLSYLIRRLLESGANSSFVNRIIDPKISIESLIKNPIELSSEKFKFKPHPSICLPIHIYSNRLNAIGYDVDHYQNLSKFKMGLDNFLCKEWESKPLIFNLKSNSKSVSLYSPSDTKKKIGEASQATIKQVDIAIQHAVKAFKPWSNREVSERSKMLQALANLLEKNYSELIALLMLEAGKTIVNCISEIREAIDFCRYYAMEAEEKLSKASLLRGVTGEENWYMYEGRGAIVCISPWNFPLAIFLGQVAAALAAGNTVLAKASEQTTLVAYKLIELCYEAGIPKDVIQLVQGPGSKIGNRMVSSTEIAGVIFTGSTWTAKHISRQIAANDGPIIPFIAETGGQNCMILDSSVFPEQVVRDIISSGFDSAGQRCSSLRVLLIEEDIADNILEMLSGAMDCLNIGNACDFKTDIGPIIDDNARSVLEKHVEHCRKKAKILKRVQLSKEQKKKGFFFEPTLVEIPNIEFLKEEIFGPIVHVYKYNKLDLNKILDEVNKLGYGLTFGIHSRIHNFYKILQKNMQVGNVYVNRNMVGAVVGAQPFGGRGLSGTGPKAGGPLYLYRLVNEKSICINTTAIGGNAELLSLDQDKI